MPIKGLLHIAVLTVIKGKPAHGSEIHRRLTEKLNVNADKPVVYTVLRKMEELAYLKSEWDTKSNGPAKRIYKITTRGLNHLKNTLEDLEKIKNVISLILSDNRGGET
ncbi:MAG: PadR family transcriptional regulator [Candidatus Odinarchaeia archaeon]